jgi:hypothetical protein
MFSTPVKGSNINGTKLSWWRYYIHHCLGTGWQSFRLAFISWLDLVWFTDNWKQYALIECGDDPFESTRDYFWDTLNEDEVLDKEFLEYLEQLSADVQSGKVETIAWEDVEHFFNDDTLSTK